MKAFPSCIYRTFGCFLMKILVWWKSRPYLRLIIHLAALVFLIVGYSWVVSTHFTGNHLLKQVVSGCMWIVVGYYMSKDHCPSAKYSVSCCRGCVTPHTGEVIYSWHWTEKLKKLPLPMGRHINLRFAVQSMFGVKSQTQTENTKICFLVWDQGGQVTGCQESLILLLRPTWWKEKIDSSGCPPASLWSLHLSYTPSTWTLRGTHSCT